MFYMIRENIVLLFALFLALSALSIGFYNNPILMALGDRRYPLSTFAALKRPFLMFWIAIRHGRRHFVAIMILFLLSMHILNFTFLYYFLPLTESLILFIPITAVILFLLYYLLWFCTIFINRIIDVGNAKFNVIFSLVTLEQILIYSALPMDGVWDSSPFYLTLIDLAICYIMSASALRMVLTETLKKTPTFTHRNLWKVALTLLIEFFMELSLFCYAGSLYFADAYNTPLTLFDAFYFVVITFGTIGYGDIIPTCTYSKIISIVITFTSIICISIMLSSFLTASKNLKTPPKH